MPERRPKGQGGVVGEKGRDRTDAGSRGPKAGGRMVGMEESVGMEERRAWRRLMLEREAAAGTYRAFWALC